MNKLILAIAYTIANSLKDFGRVTYCSNPLYYQYAVTKNHGASIAFLIPVYLSKLMKKRSITYISKITGNGFSGGYLWSTMWVFNNFECLISRDFELILNLISGLIVCFSFSLGMYLTVAK